MLKKRIIPCLDIFCGKVVKGRKFRNFTTIGDPVSLARSYEQAGADELVVLDISASCENKDPPYSLISNIANEISIPLTVGGGIKTIENIRKILACGADRVSINSSAVINSDIIKEASAEFGKQCIVASMDVNNNNIFICSGKKQTNLNFIEWAKKCEELGAGELLFTSINSDGIKKGYDINNINLLTRYLNIPIIASGGCGSIEDIIEVFNKTNCDAALIASLLHYKGANIFEIKARMKEEGIPCRMI